MTARRSFTTSIVTVLVLGAGAVALEWSGAQHSLVSAQSDSQATANAASPSPQSKAPIDLTVNGHHVDVPQNGTSQVTSPDGSQTTVTSSQTSGPQPSSGPLSVTISQNTTGGNSESFSSVTQSSDSFGINNDHVTSSSSSVTSVTTP